MAQLTIRQLDVQNTTLDLDAALTRSDPVPWYLRAYYWWVYIHPKGVRLFDRQWLVNLLLSGNYERLREAALNELGKSLPGATLQLACVYGDLSLHLGRRAADGRGTLDIVDVLPIQLQNLSRKLPIGMPIRLLAMDSTELQMRDGTYDRVLIFFLLHEQPPDFRRRTLREVFRVVKLGGKIVIVDYARPRWWHPLQYLWRPILSILEPFALDLWREEIRKWMPAATHLIGLRSQSFSGGLYQMIVVTRRDGHPVAG